ncbi:MAG: flavodoxin family protein [Spirochaetales bacterium]|nr:flavodoxin family protein [Spirochaetales bacterium]
MKILFLNGSPRRNGNTNHLIDMIIANLDNKIYQPVKEQIADYEINFCRGCQTCKKTRQCVQNDDYFMLYKKLCLSDIICLATPSYWGYVTGQLKVFFDRTTPYCDTIDGGTTFPYGKYGMAISIRAGTTEAESIEIIKAIRHYFSHLEVEMLESFHLEEINSPEDIDKKCEKIENYTAYLNNWGKVDSNVSVQ